MKIKKLSLIFLISFILFTTSLASADVSVNYEVLDAISTGGGNLIYGTSAIDGVTTAGYVCANSDCSLIGNQIAGLTTYSSNNIVRVVFPTELISPNGYAIYFYKDGYIGWEQYGIKVFGNIANPINAPDPVYLSRKNSGMIPITKVSGIKDISVEESLNININLVSDSSAIEDLRHVSNLPVSEHLNAMTRLIVLNSIGNTIINSTTNEAIPYSGEVTSYFNQIFNIEGTYNIIIQSEIIDDKILDKHVDVKSFVISVSGTTPVVGNKTGNCKIDNFSYTPTNPKKDEIVNFNVDYSADFFDENGTATTGETNLSVFVYNESDILLDHLDYNLNGSLTDHSFDYEFEDIGIYNVTLTLCPIVSNYSEDNCSITSVLINISETIIPPTRNGTGNCEILDIDYSPSRPEEDEEVDFSIEYSANFFDENGTATTGNLQLNILIEEDNIVIDELNYILNGSLTDYEFEYEFKYDEEYEMIFKLCPIVSNYSEDNCSIWYISVDVEESDDDEDDEESWDEIPSTRKFDSTIKLVEPIFIGGGSESKDNWFFIWILFAGILIVLILILIILKRK